METTDRYTEWLEGVKFLIYQQKKIRQTELARIIKAGDQHVNAILKGRRKAGPDLQDSISRALGMGHDEVRNLGREALGLPRLIVATGNYVLPRLQIRGEGHVVQNGVGNIVQGGVVGEAKGGEARDEIRAEIEGWLAERFSKLSVSAKVAAREAIRQAVPDFAEYVAEKGQ